MFVETSVIGLCRQHIFLNRTFLTFNLELYILLPCLPLVMLHVFFTFHSYCYASMSDVMCMSSFLIVERFLINKSCLTHLPMYDTYCEKPSFIKKFHIHEHKFFAKLSKLTDCCCCCCTAFDIDLVE